MNTKTIAKIISVLIVLGAFINENLSLLESLGLSENIIGWIKFGGLAIAALLPSISHQRIGGSNPPPIKDDK